MLTIPTIAYDRYFEDQVPTQQPGDILADALVKARTDRFYVAVSGGTDSMMLLTVCAAHPAFAGVVHVNTGIGLEETRQFVRDYCAARCYPYWEVYPWLVSKRDGRPNECYLDLVRMYGLPGKPLHDVFYGHLKSRALSFFGHQRKAEGVERVLLASGVRNDESVRRMKVHGARARTFYDKAIGLWWTSPIFWANDREKAAFIERYEVPKARASQLIQMSGECLCGAMANPGDVRLLQRFYPSMWREIEFYQWFARKVGKHCEWGVTPKAVGGQAQEAQRWKPLCTGCLNRQQLPLFDPDWTPEEEEAAIQAEEAIQNERDLMGAMLVEDKAEEVAI
jgi:3'-phosphoadenosine 5'-phosphosulfate sulfotransferase (PAPS reductase)/FAD synthetase